MASFSKPRQLIAPLTGRSIPATAWPPFTHSACSASNRPGAGHLLPQHLSKLPIPIMRAWRFACT